MLETRLASDEERGMKRAERSGQAERSMLKEPTTHPAQFGSKGAGLSVPRRNVPEGGDPFAMVPWELRTARLNDQSGAVLFEQAEVEVPAFWSQNATNIVVQKYFRGAVGSAQRETSVRQLVTRVVDTLTEWGLRQGYFATSADGRAFHDELAFQLLTQRGAFNSPVWFNVGVEARPQCSACFINSVEDSMASILDLAKTEGMLFKYGSGAGSNLSPLRSAKEILAGGGTASGPVSFMKGFDAFAGVIKSGGKTRRAAKMVILNASHPDIREFARCKAHEEKKAWALIDAGYDGSFNGEAYASVFFQNANHSVRVTDAFMEAVADDRDWTTTRITDGKPAETFKARALWSEITAAAHLCGDPGLQFDTTVNHWNPCKGSGRINASNPCSEFMFLDDSACNLASLNLLKFRDGQGELDLDALRHATALFILAQEIIVDNASYPTGKIERQSRDFRPLGLGYANLGSLLMARGLPYDSHAGRAYAAGLTALMTGQAYATSAEIARSRGPFAMYTKNRQPFLEVIRCHRSAVEGIDTAQVPAPLLAAARRSWDEALTLGEEYGYRNAQVTLLAPTGTIGFMMDCDTTGVEPDIALVKYKKLTGGGQLKMVNGTVTESLRRLGYDEAASKEILAHIEAQGSVEGCAKLKPEHLPVFDCAMKPRHGERSIEPLGHVRMMGAVQPFLSGAISKTVNLPHEATVADIGEIYLQAWKLGLKSIALYRDGSKRTQPMSTSDKSADHGKSSSKALVKVEAEKPKAELLPAEPPIFRRRLRDERQAVTHKFSVGGHEGYMTVGLYDDGSPGELFVTMSKEGSTISGFMDGFATSVSLALQYGVPLKVLVDKFSHARFEPSGFTGNPQIPMAKSITDYIFRWMGLKFLPPDQRPFDPSAGQQDLFFTPPADSDSAEQKKQKSDHRDAVAQRESHVFATQSDAPPCSECGAIMVRSGACYKCLNCGSSSGCS